MRQLLALGSLLLAALTTFSFASTDDPGGIIRQAEKLSSLTGPEARPFHLKLTISEPANSQSPYSARIEEFWESANDWSRTVVTPELRQQVTVAGGTRVEQNTGDYYPLWLRSFVTAAIDPLQDAAFWEQVSARVVQTTSHTGQMSSRCARAQFKIGTATVSNDAFAVICFNEDGTLSSVVRPGYSMEFQNVREFGKKRIAYRYVSNPEPGTEIVGQVAVLEDLAVRRDTPLLPSPAEQNSGPIKSIRVSQESFEALSSAPIAIAWPKVHSGHTSGKLSMYVSTDGEGHIREAYPLNSDNAGLQDAARDQLLKLQLRPATAEGRRVQTEAGLTFQFTTELEDSSGSIGTPAAQPLAPTYKPIAVSPAVANSLRVKSYAPLYPQGLKERRVSGKVDLTAVIGRKGEIVSLSPLSSTDPEFTGAAIAAVQQWIYKPYLLNGAPVEIETVITVNFQAR